MSEIARFNPTGRFTGLADVYAKHRPDYPADAVEYVVQQSGLTGDALLVDVGSGTGIAARLFAARGVNVIGVEPNDEMRGRAEAETVVPGVRYVKGTAESTGLADGSATAVLAAQAFHWFDAPAALREFHRILRPGGAVALMWNEREESDPCTSEYGAVVRTCPDGPALEDRQLRAGIALLECPLFVEAHRALFHHEQPLDEESLVGRALSASYAPREPRAVDALTAKLHDIFVRYQREGRIVLKYETRLYYGKRAGDSC